MFRIRAFAAPLFSQREANMDRRIKYLTFHEAAQYLVDAGAVAHRMGVGARADMRWLSIPAGIIEAGPDGKFARADLNRLVSWTQEMRRGEM